MKRAPHHHILKFALIISIVCLSAVSHAQHVLSQLEVQGGAWHAGNEYMVNDPAGNYYIGLNNGTSRISFIIGDTSVLSYRSDPLNDNLNLSDFYFLRFDEVQHLTGSFVIDNAEFVRDFYSSGDHSFISMMLHSYPYKDSLYPITLGGEVVIDRAGNRGRGLLIVLDDSMKLQKSIFPSTGGLGQIAADGDYVYMELLIPDQAPYILVGQDTVHNFVLNEGGLEYGFQTVVLCKYDYVNEQVIWWKRIGNAGSEVLKDMLLDSKGNLVIHGWTSSRKFTFSETDTILNYQADKPFIGKYSPSGDFIWGILNTDQYGELFTSITLDHDDNVYSIGQYSVHEFHVEDTVLFNVWKEEFSPTIRSIIIKYGSDGRFKWASQLDGDFDSSDFYDIVNTNDDRVIVSGKFRFGSIKFGQTMYYNTSPSEDNAFLWVLDGHNGKYLSHSFNEGTAIKWYRNLQIDNEGNLNLYMILSGTEELFGEDFSSYNGNLSGFMLKLTNDFPSWVFELPQTEDLFEIFPNPVSAGSIFYINTLEKYKYDHVDYAISNLPGNIVTKGSEYSSNGRVSINTTGLIPGVYFISIGTGSITRTEMLILE